MDVTPQIFDHIAKLAKLQFAIDEKEALRQEMQKMVSFVEKLNEVDTSHVEPLTHMSLQNQIPRKDIAQNGNSKIEGLKNVPQKNEDYVLVPKVIENPNK
jgi:aspartyl-tRNA(Asn)/glutamyl-tRNA(Gln) amidotransferase subunit C